MNHQQDLFTDLPRGEQLASLRKLKLDAHQCKSGKVSGAVQKSVLKVIDDHQGHRDCFVSQETIADESGYGLSTVRRAIAALVDQDLITRDRPNHWSPNHHRINWTEVTRLARGTSERSTAHHERSSVHTSTSDRSQEHVREFTKASPTVHHEPRNAPTNRPDEWAAVARDLFNWGLKSAMSSIVIARQRGLSIEHVRELWLESGGDREPTRWEPGQLANWLTGLKPLPFDEAEAIRRREARSQNAQQRSQAHDEKEAERIRRQARFDARGRNVTEEAIQTVTLKRLRLAGLERFAMEAAASD